MLDFRVDTFLAVCRCMSFTRAAAALHITQPAVSQHIRALEAQYGVRFFSFEGKKLTLTDAGRLFLRTATSATRWAACPAAGGGWCSARRSPSGNTSCPPRSRACWPRSRTSVSA